MSFRPGWTRVPIIEPLDHRRANVYEHTPLDPYGSGEYPRFIRPPGAHGSPRWRWERLMSDEKQR